jgi:hypothetical protein
LPSSPPSPPVSPSSPPPPRHEHGSPPPPPQAQLAPLPRPPTPPQPSTAASAAPAAASSVAMRVVDLGGSLQESATVLLAGVRAARRPRLVCVGQRRFSPRLRTSYLPCPASLLVPSSAGPSSVSAAPQRPPRRPPSSTTPVAIDPSQPASPLLLLKSSTSPAGSHWFHY